MSDKELSNMRRRYETATVTDRRDTDDHIDKDVTVDTDEGWYSRDVSDMSDYLSYQV